MEIVMPQMGESINEGTIIKWHKKVGDSVKLDEIIFEISTDKVDTEIPSPGDGILKEIKFQEGDTVDVGTVVAILNITGEIPESTPKEDSPEIKVEESAGELKKEKVSEAIKTSQPESTY
ncbi:MAG: hypothetical protein K8H86_02135, partial [Ignavibacteriaceae bacterium]|nr:hypothetical protein [Ignavibacteriaceae bacterium]